MAKRPSYFIRLPASPEHGVRGGFYPIDPRTLQWAVLAEIYKREGGRYVPAYGMGPGANIGNDPSELLEHWRTTVAQMQESLPDSGLAGDLIQELIGALDSLPRLLQALARGRITEAGSALDALSGDLTTLVVLIAETVTDLEARVAEHRAPAQTPGDVREELYLATTESLADSIDEGLSAYGALIALEAELDALIEALEQTHNWPVHVPMGPQWLPEQLHWLGEDDGFCRVASRFLIQRDPSLIQYMVTVIGGNGGVRDRLQDIATRIADARAGHNALRGRADAALEQQFQIDALIRTMQEAREEVAKLSRSGIDPYELVKDLITVDEFTTWQGLQGNPEWQSLLAVNHRLRDKIQLVHQLIVQVPALSPAEAKVIGAVEHYVGLVEAMLTELGQPTRQTPVPSPAVTTSTVMTAIAPSSQRQAALPSGVDPARLETLYGLMLAVGAVKYCGEYNLIGGTPKAIFDLLEALGRMTPDERQVYGAALRQLLASDSVSVEESGMTRLEAWLKTDPRRFHWIQFKQGRGRSERKYTLWRLVEQFHDAGLALCAKYNLDPAAIEAAFDARRAARTPKQ